MFGLNVAVPVLNPVAPQASDTKVRKSTPVGPFATASRPCAEIIVSLTVKSSLTEICVFKLVGPSYYQSVKINISRVSTLSRGFMRHDARPV